MNLKLILLAVCVAFLSACSNRQAPDIDSPKSSRSEELSQHKADELEQNDVSLNSPERVDSPERVNSPEPINSPELIDELEQDQSSKETAKQGEVKKLILRPNTQQPTDTDVQGEQIQSQKSLTTIAQPETVFDRLRTGFALPELDSIYVDDYLRWKTGHPTYLANLFKRAQPFLPHLVKEVQARGMPMEIVLLPAVESAFKPRAISRSKAAGLWQFIPSTGRSFGLEQNWWYDGRRDALRATTAALDYLAQLNAMFDGDWWLTLAAYNAGPGTVKRAIKSNRRKGKPLKYQDLSLRSETRRYVPKLIALREIIRSPEKFGVELPDIRLDAAFVAIPINHQIDLRKFAEASQTDLDELRHLNASFKRWSTPPTGEYTLLVPLPHRIPLERLTEIALTESGVEFIPVVVERGDSLSTLAEQYKASVASIRQANNMTGSALRAGQTLLIPVVDGVATSTSSTQSSANSNASLSNKVIHTVKRGDTLWSISRKYKVGVSQLAEWNQLAIGQILRLNQQLLVLLK